MTLEEARQHAAVAWTYEDNEQKEMDPDLAEAFARILWIRVDQAEKSLAIQQARHTFAAAFAEDEGFHQGYIANVAMLLHDRYGIIDFETRNAAARDILKLIFESR